MAGKQQSDDNTENEKPVYVTLVKNGDIIHKTFTYAEAEKEGILSPVGYALIDSDDPGPIRSDGIVCPSDGYTQREFEKSGRMGCPQCYQTFRTHIQPLLERMHKGMRHVGKIPGNINDREILVAKVDHLRLKLNTAVHAERFEDAAQLRDDIEGLEAALAECGVISGPHLLLIKSSIAPVQGIPRISHSPTEIRDRFKSAVQGLS